LAGRHVFSDAATTCGRRERQRILAHRSAAVLLDFAAFGVARLVGNVIEAVADPRLSVRAQLFQLALPTPFLVGSTRVAVTVVATPGLSPAPPVSQRIEPEHRFERLYRQDTRQSMTRRG